MFIGIFLHFVTSFLINKSYPNLFFFFFYLLTFFSNHLINYYTRPFVLTNNENVYMLKIVLWSFNGSWVEQPLGCWMCPDFLKHSRALWWRHTGKYTFSRCCIDPKTSGLYTSAPENGPWHGHRDPGWVPKIISLTVRHGNAHRKVP